MLRVSARELGLALLLAAGLAGAARTAWAWLGLPPGAFTPGLEGHGPDPLAWSRLFVGWVPAAHAAFAVAYWSLGRGDRGAPVRRHFLLDQATLAVPALLVVALRAAGAGGSWRFVLASGYALFVASKTALFLHALWTWLGSESVPARRAAVAVGLGALLPYALLVGSVTIATSAVGDEPHYLLTAHSLLHDGDSDVANNLARRDYLPFYWGRLEPNHSPWYIAAVADPGRQYRGLQPLLLLPGYWLAGRAGAALTMALVTAAALALAFWLAAEAGGSLRAGFLAWLGAAFSAPIVSLATSPFPEMSAALFLTAAAAALLRAPPRSARLVVAGSLTALLAVKTRLLLMAAPLLLALAPRPTPRRLAGLALAALAAGLATAAYDTFVTGGLLVAYLRGGGPLGIADWAPRTLLGYLFDQEYGLLLGAPALALGLCGAVIAFCGRRYRLLWVTFGPFAATWLFFGLAVGATYGGFAPPARYLAASLPLLVPLAALAYARLRGRLSWCAAAAAQAATVLYALALAAWPAWRFQHGAGRATVLARLWDASGLDFGRLVPSFIAPAPSAVVVALGALACLVGAGWWLAARPGAAPPPGTVGIGVATLVLALAAPAGWLSWRPEGTFPAAGWHGRGGVSFHGTVSVQTGGGEPGPREELVWAVQRPAALAVAPRLGTGRYRLVIRAGGMGADGGPTLAVWAAGAPVGRVALEAAPPPTWRRADYTYEVTWAGGRLPLRLEVTDVSGREPIRLAYLEHVRVERLGPP